MQYLSSSTSQVDYDSDPVQAMTSYSQLMHMHTKKQMDAAKRVSRRRSGDSGVKAEATITKEGSIDSTSSRGSSISSY